MQVKEEGSLLPRKEEMNLDIRLGGRVGEEGNRIF